MYSTLNKFLVFWYAGYQAIHIPVNVRGLIWLHTRKALDFPAPPPPEGWDPQVIYFFIGMASLDLVNAFLSIGFAWGYFRRKSWAIPLGLVTLTISIYAALLFDYATIAAGAWSSAGFATYMFINVAFFPVVWLYVKMLGTIGKTGRVSNPDD